MKASRKTAYIGLLTAAAVALSFLESLLPVLPFLPPGAKAGFSNIITMFAASFLGLGPALCIALLKSVFVLVTRGMAAFAMSVCGGLLSTLVMWLCLKHKGSLLATGVLGAVSHNTAQLAAAVLITGTPGLVYYYPLLFLFAVAAGIITGLLLKVIYPPLCTLAERMIPSEQSKQSAPQKRG